MYGGYAAYKQAHIHGANRPSARAVKMYGTRRQQIGVGPSYKSYARGRGIKTLTTAKELKFHDVDQNDAEIAINGTILAGGTMNVIPQGLTGITRIGRRVIIKQIHWRYSIELDESVLVQHVSDVIRVMLYQDTQANGATASVTDILASDDYQSWNNLNNKGRFLILHDKTYTMNSLAGAGNGTANDWSNRFIVAEFHKKMDLPIEFSGADGAIDKITSNNLGVLLLSKVGSTCIFDSKIRLRFYD